MNRSLFPVLLLLVLVTTGLRAEVAEAKPETQLFIVGQTDETGEVYGAATEEADLRSFLIEKGLAAFVKLEVKDGWATGTMRLLRKDDNGAFTVSKLRFNELLSLTLSWKVAGPQDVRGTRMARSHVDDFMHAAKTLLAKPEPQ